MTVECTLIHISWPGVWRLLDLGGREGLLSAFLGFFSNPMQFVHTVDPRLYPVIPQGVNTYVTSHSG